MKGDFFLNAICPFVSLKVRKIDGLRPALHEVNRPCLR